MFRGVIDRLDRATHIGRQASIALSVTAITFSSAALAWIATKVHPLLSDPSLFFGAGTACASFALCILVSFYAQYCHIKAHTFDTQSRGHLEFFLSDSPFGNMDAVSKEMLRLTGMGTEWFHRAERLLTFALGCLTFGVCMTTLVFLASGAMTGSTPGHP